MLQKIRYFAFLLGVLVVVIVAFQNQEPVDIDLLFFNGRYPLMLLLLATSGASFVLGALMGVWQMRRRAKAKAAKAKKKAQATQVDVPEPIVDESPGASRSPLNPSSSQ